MAAVIIQRLWPTERLAAHYPPRCSAVLMNEALCGITDAFCKQALRNLQLIKLLAALVVLLDVSFE